MAIVYLHKRKDNKEVFYVGIGKTEKRAYSKKDRNRFWINYTNKHQYFVEVLVKDVSWEEACIIEKELISFYGRRDLGFGLLVNLTDGGEGSIGAVISKETRDKISKANFGRKLSAEHKTKISEANRGKNKSTEHIEKMRIANLGKKHSEETRRKISEAGKMRIQTEEQKINRSKTVVQYDKNMNYIREFVSAKKAGEELKVNKSSITGNCKGKLKTAGGFIWKYKNN